LGHKRADRARHGTVGRREKVRPGTGRETGLGHAAVARTRTYSQRVPWRALSARWYRLR